MVDRGPEVPDDREHIFDMTSPSEAREQTIHRGFGVGLAGAARIAKTLEGSIRAEPGDGGVGKKIIFDIPWRDG